MNRILAIREGGAVQRFHASPHLCHYDVAQHSWGMAAMLFVLNPDASRELIYACLFHDVAERWVGDMPAPMKWSNKIVQEEMHRTEERIERQLGINIQLTEIEQKWLKALDLLDLYIFCMHERAMGNTLLNKTEELCLKMLTEEPWIPSAVTEWVQNTLDFRRTTDWLTKDI